jgi:hypothetical protein
MWIHGSILEFIGWVSFHVIGIYKGFGHCCQSGMSMIYSHARWKLVWSLFCSKIKKLASVKHTNMLAEIHLIIEVDEEETLKNNIELEIVHQRWRQKKFHTCVWRSNDPAIRIPFAMNSSKVTWRSISSRSFWVEGMVVERIRVIGLSIMFQNANVISLKQRYARKPIGKMKGNPHYANSLKRDAF